MTVDWNAVSVLARGAAQKPAKLENIINQRWTIGEWQI